MYLNTDPINEYLLEYFANGVPASSVKTREIFPFSYRTPHRDDIVQRYSSWYNRFLIDEKVRTVFSSDPSLYHQSRLSRTMEWAYASRLERAGILHGRELFDHCMNTPVDMIICSKHDDGECYIDFAHLVFPNGWGADEAIGKPFSYFHSHIKNSANKNVLPESNKFVDYMVNSGKIFERVGAFSLRASHTLNRHPTVVKPECFDPITNVFVRFERQVIWSIPELRSFVFIIHTHHVDVRNYPELFLNAFNNCSEDSHTMYRTLQESGPQILSYLEGFINGA